MCTIIRSQNLYFLCLWSLIFLALQIFEQLNARVDPKIKEDTAKAAIEREQKQYAQSQERLASLVRPTTYSELCGALEGLGEAENYVSVSAESVLN